MDVQHDSGGAPEMRATEIPDEFASGEPNRLRRLPLRLAGWLFRPPYFPPVLIWLMLALIAANAAVELLSQPAAYWIDPSVSTNFTFVGTPLRWGLWTVGIYVGYMLLAGLALSLINARPAFVLWMGLGVSHFWFLTLHFRCYVAYYFPFENTGNCAQTHSLALAAAGILWGLTLAAAVRLGPVPWLAVESGAPSKWTRSLQTASIASIALMSLAVALAAVSVPRPAWRLVRTAHAPAGRTEAALAYDTSRSVAVLFGGTTSWSPSAGWKSVGDTWEWDGSDWNELHPAHSPSPRYSAGMAFDEKRGVSVLFGGSVQDPSSQPKTENDTWEWDGRDWLEVTPAFSPPARRAASMFFDPLRGTVVIYGGSSIDPANGTETFLDDAWEWDGKVWRQIVLDETRRSATSAIVFDRVSQLPLLMDGEGLWSWQGAIWVQPNSSTNPPGRWSSQLTYDPGHQQVVLFGGFKDADIFADTWLYDGQSWKQVFTAVQPPARSGHKMFYDQRRARLVLFGGLSGGTFYDDTWEFIQP